MISPLLTLCSMKAFPLISGTREMSTDATFIQYNIRSPTQSNLARNQRHPIRKEKVAFSIFADDVIIHTKS